MASITTRARPNGSIELRVIHPFLGKPYYSSHDDETKARGYGERLVKMLDDGRVPPELSKPTQAPRSTSISAVLRDYLNRAPIAKSDVPMVEYLRDNLTVTLAGVTVKWTDDWVLSMKRIEHLAPGTIRKRVESLARAIDWHYRQQHGDSREQLPINPLRTLPRGYSTYKEDEAPQGKEAKVDVERDRRLLPGEEPKILAVIEGEKRGDRQRPLDMPDRDAFKVFWLLIANTGLRMREAYRLRVKDVRFDQRTIHVYKSKKGRIRDVPMTRFVFDLLRGHTMPDEEDALIFPFWSGEDDEKVLAKTSSKLSSRFATLHDYAGSPDLTEHDLRHEATCRWMLLRDRQGRWMYRPEEVRRITGHKSVQQFERYLSLRGSDLAEPLWE